MLYRNDSFRPRVTGCTFKRVWESCLSMIFLYASFVCKPFTCLGKGFFVCVAKILFLTYIFKINKMAGGTVEGNISRLGNSYLESLMKYITRGQNL